MSEVAETNAFDLATGSEPVEEQPAEVGSEAEIEQPDAEEVEGGEEIPEEGGEEETGEELEEEEAGEEETLLAGKFKTPEALAEAYENLERKLTDTSSKNSRMTDLIMDRLGKNLKGESEKQPEAKPMTEAEYQEFMQNPQATIDKMIRERFGELSSETRATETEYDRVVSTAMDAAQAELKNDPVYAEMSPEAQEFVAEIMEEPGIKQSFDAINVQNFREHGAEGAMVHFREMLKYVQDIAEGRAARKSIHNATAKANKKAKESYLKKSKAKGTKPPAAPKPKGKVAGGGSAYMDNLAGIK